LSRDRSFASNSQAVLLVVQPTLTAEDPWIAHIASADVKTRKDHWSTLHASHAAFADRSLVWTPRVLGWSLGCIWDHWFYCVRFPPYFNLDSPTLHFLFSPFGLEFILDICRDFPHPRRIRARRCAPYDDLVNFLILRHRLLSHTTLCSLLSADSQTPLSFLFSHLLTSVRKVLVSYCLSARRIKTLHLASSRGEATAAPLSPHLLCAFDCDDL